MIPILLMSIPVFVVLGVFAGGVLTISGFPEGRPILKWSLTALGALAVLSLALFLLVAQRISHHAP